MLCLCFLPSIKMCLILGEIKLKKNEFCKSKQPMYLNQVEIVILSFQMNLSFMIVLKVLLDIKMVELLHHYVIFYLR